MNVIKIFTSICALGSEERRKKRQSKTVSYWTITGIAREVWAPHRLATDFFYQAGELATTWPSSVEPTSSQAFQLKSTGHLCFTARRATGHPLPAHLPVFSCLFLGDCLLPHLDLQAKPPYLVCCVSSRSNAKSVGGVAIFFCAINFA